MKPIEKAAEITFFLTDEQQNCQRICDRADKCPCQMNATRKTIKTFLDGIQNDPEAMERVDNANSGYASSVIKALKQEANR